MSRLPANGLNIRGGLAKAVRQQGRKINFILAIAVALVVGSLLTVGAFINDSLAEKKAISLDMRDKISEQNYKIDALTEEIRHLSQRPATEKTK